MFIETGSPFLFSSIDPGNCMVSDQSIESVENCQVPLKFIVWAFSVSASIIAVINVIIERINLDC